MPEIIDISLPIYDGMPVYPGTAETKITSVSSASGGSVLSEISLTSHTGTHIDAPSHAKGGKGSIDTLLLDTFYGKCRVLDLNSSQEKINREDLELHKIKPGERILLKTSNSARGFNKFYSDYVYLSGEAAEFLGKTGVKLVGIDALSIKQQGSPDNRPHTALLSRNIPIIEGLKLAEAEPGQYKLVALPLAFKDLDGSPTRAVLLPLS